MERCRKIVTKSGAERRAKSFVQVKGGSHCPVIWRFAIWYWVLSVTVTEPLSSFAAIPSGKQLERKENSEMKELAKRFIGEECIIYTITSNDGSVQGVIKEIDDGGMVIEKKTGELEIVNLDFVTRIRQYPRKKNGKKKDIVLD